MKDTLRTRLEFLWAKLAGRDVDIDTLTPDAPTNMIEKLMIETADRIADAEQGSGGGGNSTLRIKVTDGIEADTYVSDTTFAEIVEAIEAGNILVCDVDVTMDYGSFHATLSSFARNYDAESGELLNIVFVFDSWMLVQDTPTPFMVAVVLDNNMEQNGVGITILPLATPSV